MNGCLIIMPVLFRGGSEKQIRLIIDGIEGKKDVLSVIVECRDASMDAVEREYVKNHPNTHFVFLDSNSLETKYKNACLKYLSKVKSLILLINAVKREIKRNHIRVAMVTNLTGLVLVPWFRFLGCEVIYNERNPGIKVCDSIWKRKLLLKCKKLVCNSKYASQHMHRMLNREIEVINNGIIPIDEDNTPISDGVFRIIVPARISRVKNQMILLEAINRLKDTMNLHITFAGVYEDESYYQILKNYMKANCMEKFIDFIGFTSNMLYLYQTSNLLVLPSLEEGTPNVLLEAYMCHLPVLASNIPMNIDCLQDKSYLFDPNDAKDLADKICWISKLESDKKKEITGINYAFVLEYYGVKKMQDRYISLLFVE